MIATLLLISQSTPLGLRLVNPQEYSVKRFNEVVDAHLETKRETLQERIIEMRAHLVVAERDLENMNRSATNTTTDPASRISAERIKAGQAMIDHYRLQVQKLEAEALLQNKKKSKRK